MSFVMLTYDVPQERGAVFRRTLRRYLGHEQFSVYFGELPGSTLEKLRMELRKIVQDGDRVLEFVAENRNNIDIRTWTKHDRATGIPEVVEDTRHKSESVVL